MRASTANGFRALIWPTYPGSVCASSGVRTNHKRGGPAPVSETVPTTSRQRPGRFAVFAIHVFTSFVATAASSVFKGSRLIDWMLSNQEETSARTASHEALFVFECFFYHCLGQLAHKSERHERLFRDLAKSCVISAFIQGVRLALEPLRHPKPGMGPFLGPFFGRNGPLWSVLGFEISMQEPNFEPFSWFGHPFLE